MAVPRFNKYVCTIKVLWTLMSLSQFSCLCFWQGKIFRRISKLCVINLLAYISTTSFVVTCFSTQNLPCWKGSTVHIGACGIVNWIFSLFQLLRISIIFVVSQVLLNYLMIRILWHSTRFKQFNKNTTYNRTMQERQ